MKRAVVFGIGKRFLEHESEIVSNYDIVCLADNDKEKQGRYYKGKRILSMAEMLEKNFDVVLVIPNYNKMDIMRDLLASGLPQEKIIPWLFDAGRSWEKYELLFKDDGCYAKFDEIRFVCRTTSDFLILDEIYLYNAYGFSMGNMPLVAIDIGMNVGLASLFLAHQVNVEKVYSFEPFPETYGRALENIEMNDESIRKKIVAKNIGLGESDREVLCNMNSDCCGGANTFLFSSASAEGGILVKICDAGRIVQDIFDLHKGKRIIMKIDTEGSEYDIISSMVKNDLLQKVYALIIETHFSRENELKSMLDRYNFMYFDHLYSHDCGMIYALNRRAENLS